MVENLTGIEHFFPWKIKPNLSIFFREETNQFSSFSIPPGAYNPKEHVLLKLAFPH